MHSGDKEPSNFSLLGQRMKRFVQNLTPSIEDDHFDAALATPQQLHRQLHLAQLELEMQRDELRRKELALENANTRFINLLEYTNTLYNLAPLGHLTLTPEGNIVEANSPAAVLLDVRPAALLQQPFTYFVAADDLDRYRAFCQQVLTTTGPHRCEVRLARANGTTIHVQLDGIATQSILGEDAVAQLPQSGPYMRLIISDISARVQLEAEERRMRAQLEATLQDLHQTQEQLVRQERLAVVGQMAAGVAHDFNNIVASITLYAQLVLRVPDLPADVQKRIEAIVTQSGRAANLVQQILDFSRRSTLQRQAISLVHFVHQNVELVQHSLPDTIQVSFDIASLQAGVNDVVEIDGGRLQQVLLNLALNARDAMPEGGTLQFTLARLQHEEAMPLHSSGELRAGEWLRIEVADSGTGIKAEDLPHIFEPFFTTKGIGLGSGLGLSQVWGLIKQHNGEIDVRTAVGVGTTFTIYLPASNAVLAALAEPEIATLPQGQAEWVLVVEDSNFLRMAIVSALRQLGYQTVSASNGQEAFDLLIKAHDKIDLILTDLSMPMMGGKELIRAVRAQGWQQPIVILTGQPLSESEVVQLDTYARVTRMQKPAVMERLAHALHRALHLPAA